MSRKPDPRTNSNAWRQVRTFESECHAFERIGVSRTPRVRECELVRRFENTCVPEGIFDAPEGHAMSVEVKRIVGNTLPSDVTRRAPRKITRRACFGARSRIVWPWTSSVETALCKLDERIARAYGVKVHVAVFLVPRSLPSRCKGRVRDHIHRVAQSVLSGPTLLSTKTIYHIVECDDVFFERL